MLYIMMYDVMNANANANANAEKKLTPICVGLRVGTYVLRSFQINTVGYTYLESSSDMI
jgi:hypothetical protein